MRATQHSWCSVCEDAIRPGDDIRPPPGGEGWWVHVDCLTAAEEADRATAISASRPRCRYCADVLAPDGSCASCGG